MSEVSELKLLASKKITSANVHRINTLLHQLTCYAAACDRLKLDARKKKEFERKFGAIKSELIKHLK